MREILFRGKRVDNGEWIVGDLLQVIYPSGKPSVYSIMEQTPLATNYHVIPETAGQYTGISAKNGKRIFEGDIVTARFKSNRSPQTFKVVFENGIFLFDNGCVKAPPFDVYGIEIIGNIHDNPELLEVGV